jgi:hydrogenase-4 component B
VITGLAGIAFALCQHDLKRLLAYSSIENIGVIVMGLGLALLGRTLGHTDWVMLGLGGALLHVCNHSLFKSLLFFNIGAVIHAMHTRNMNQLGGLAKQMPQATALFVVGALGICALPPLNGFASEWLLYVGLFRTLNTHTSGFPAAAVAVVALGVIGAMAVACFVKVLGTVFLGTARSNHVAHDPQATMRMPMAILSAGCVGIGLFPMAVVPLLERAVHTWVGLPISTEGSLMALAPLQWLSVLGLVLIACAGGLVFMLKLFARSKTCGKTGTWDCGYAQPTARMQYTGASFVQSLAALFSFVLWPQYHWPTIRGFFPKSAHFRGLVPDVILDRLVLPLFNIAGRHLPRLRILQQGQTHLYVLYILVIMIVLLAWGAMGILS